MSIFKRAVSALIIVSGVSSYGAICRVPTDEKLIALTFDDGPHPYRTEEILDILLKNDVRATFFVVGQNAIYYPDVLKMTAYRGHEIGNHTFSHAPPSKLCEKSLVREISAAEEAILSACGEKPTVFRPPEGACFEYVGTASKKLGYSVILWNIDTRDWAHTSSRDIILNIKKNIRPGSIILFHDYISGESHTAEALSDVIPYLKGEGYRFVTVSELLASGK